MKRLLILTFGTTVVLVCMLMLSREIYGNEIPKETIETGNASRIFVKPEDQFEYEEVNGMLYITGYTGTEKNIMLRDLNGKTIRGIAEGALENSDIESVTMWGDGDLIIEEKAFKNCKNLKSVSFHAERIGNSAFEGCTELESINISSLHFRTYIGDYAFSNCSKLRIEDNTYCINEAYYIGDYAFWNCKNAESIALEGDETEIGDNAFYRSGIKCITINLNMPYSGERIDIGAYAFADCERLSQIKWWGIRSTVEEKRSVNIEDYAFFGCNQLKTVILPEIVENVGEYAFGYTGANCEKVKEFQIEAANKTAGCIYAINNGFKKHDKHNFLLLSYDAPNCEEEGVKEYECSVCGEHFEENIPKKEHDYVEQFVRKQSTKLREGVIEYVCSKCGDSIEGSLPVLEGNGVRFKIGDYTYQIVSMRQRLVKVTAYRGNEGKIVIPNTVEYKTNRYKVTRFSKDVFKNAKKTKEIVIGKNITVIPEKAFQKCKSLKKLEIKSKNITKIGKYAFDDLKKKAVITLPKKCRKEYTKLLKRQKTKAKILWK